MSAFFRLIRIQNLFFIALIQYLMSKVVLLPILQAYGFESTNENMLILLILASVFIAAAGYMLNDYFDVKIDVINKPERQIVGKNFSRHSVMLMHQILTGIGVLCGLLLAYFARSMTLAFIFIVVPGLLWFYSASYKRQFLIGNLVVAFVAALSILIVGISQLAFLSKTYGDLIYQTPIPGEIYGWIGCFAIFAFITTLIREIIKDIQDEKGDREMECRTIVIKLGVKNTKLILYFLILLTISLLLLFNHFFINFEGTLSVRYILFGLVLPLIILGYFIFTAKNSVDYKNASNLSKVIMLIGVLYSFIFYFLQAKTYGISLFDLFIVK